MKHMALTVPMKMNEVLVSMTVPKPASCRTAEMSFVVRDMRSPIRCRW